MRKGKYYHTEIPGLLDDIIVSIVPEKDQRVNEEEALKNVDVERVASLVSFAKQIAPEEATWDYDVLKDKLNVTPNFGDICESRNISVKLSDNDTLVTVIDEIEKEYDFRKVAKETVWKISNVQKFYEFKLQNSEILATECTLTQNAERNTIGGGVGFIRKYHNISEFCNDKYVSSNVSDLFMETIQIPEDEKFSRFKLTDLDLRKVNSNDNKSTDKKKIK